MKVDFVKRREQAVMALAFIATYRREPPEIRSVIDDMVDICGNPAASADEWDMAVDTIAEALMPNGKLIV